MIGSIATAACTSSGSGTVFAFIADSAGARIDDSDNVNVGGIGVSFPSPTGATFASIATSEIVRF